MKGSAWAEALAGRAVARLNYRDYRHAVDDLSRALDLSPRADLAALRAFVLATCPAPLVRDGAQAVTYQKQVTERLPVEERDVPRELLRLVESGKPYHKEDLPGPR